MARRASEQPTDGELELLNALWEVGPAGLGPIAARLRESREVATTTVATMLKTMVAKGLVRRADGGTGYVYEAAVARDEAASGLVGKLLRGVFDGSARRLVAHLIERGELSEAERSEIAELLRDAAPATAPKPKRGGR